MKKQISILALAILLTACSEEKMEINTDESKVINELCKQKAKWQQEKLAKLLQIEKYSDESCKQKFSVILEANSQGETADGKRGSRMNALLDIRKKFY